MKITIIGTRHVEVGKCNSNELYQILMHLNPDVIFEEMSPKKFDDYYVFKKSSKLESVAILQYKQYQDAVQIPIDSDNIPEKEFLKAYDNVHKTLDGLEDQNGVDYRSLTKTVWVKTSQQGFDYLNSVEYSNAWLQLDEIINNALIKINSSALVEDLAFWKHINDEREFHMIQCICTFCENTKFENAVFLVGAFHIPSIIDKISKNEAEIDVHWVAY